MKWPLRRECSLGIDDKMKPCNFCITENGADGVLARLLVEHAWSFKEMLWKVSVLYL